MKSPTDQSFRWRRILLTFVAILTVSFGMLAWCIYDVITLSREAAGLRNTFFSLNGAPRSTTIQFSAGPWLLRAARLVAGQMKEVPPEALLALRSVRSASVGVYELRPSQSIDGAAIKASDERMRLRGWHRAVGVRDGRNTVLIYTSARERRGEELKVCLAVVDEHELVLVSGVVAGRYLLPLISKELARRSMTTAPVEQI